MKNLLYVLSVGVLVLGSGCASTQQFAHFPDQNRRVEDPEKARIYVVRPTSFAAAVSMRVSDGKTVIGKTGPNGYLCWERSPGEMEILSKAENTARLPLTVEKNKVYYVGQHVRMGILFARNSLSSLPESDGEAKVAKCRPPKLVAD